MGKQRKGTPGRSFKGKNKRNERGRDWLLGGAHEKSTLNGGLQVTSN